MTCACALAGSSTANTSPAVTWLPTPNRELLNGAAHFGHNADLGRRTQLAAVAQGLLDNALPCLGHRDCHSRRGAGRGRRRRAARGQEQHDANGAPQEDTRGRSTHAADSLSLEQVGGSSVGDLPCFL